jgi:hypothetical protein
MPDNTVDVSRSKLDYFQNCVLNELIDKEGGIRGRGWGRGT